MRLLHVIASVNPAGGGPIEGIHQLSRGYAELGVSFEVASPDGPSDPWVRDSDLPVHALGPGRSKYRYAPQLLSWLRANRARYDAVIVNGIWQYHSFAAWRALHGSETPYFVFTHGMLDPYFKERYPLKHLKKSVYWPLADYRVLRDARAVIFTSEEERLQARRSFRLYKANEAVTIYGTTPPEALQPGPFLAAHPHLADKRIVLFLSRIHEKKGCDLLIEAFAAVAPEDERLHLVMAGPDQAGWVPALQARAKQLGLDDRVSWVGMVSGTDKWSAYAAAEAFCLPSHQENFGIAVAEALACGRPVLISDKVNIWREIQADAAGFVDEDTVDGTTRNLRRWMALAPEEYRSMCGRARSCFDARFDARRASRRLVEIIQENTR
jgi:glycosyltransferase involved in cell wall biosynthesis